MNNNNFKELIIAIFTLCVFIGISVVFFNSEVQNTEITEETPKNNNSAPKVELLKYNEDISEFSLHYINGTLINISEKPVKIIVYADAYDEEGKYIDTYIDIAQHLEPQTEWDFYIKVSNLARKIKLRDFEVIDGTE